MKKSLMYLMFAACCTMGVFTSCSDDDDNVVCPIENTTFTAENGLELSYNGVALPGKSVTFTPGDNGKATITLAGNTDLTDLLASNRSNLQLAKSNGVFPGEVTTTFEVNLKVNGDQVTFAGSAESQNCTFDYEGSANKGNLKLALNNVALKNNALAGTTWKLNNNQTEENPAYPIHVKWESGSDLNIGGFPLAIDGLLQLALTMPIIPDGSVQEGGVSVVNMLQNVLQDVTFEADGNITATYMDAVKGGTTWTQSPKNLAQYCIDSDNQMRVFLNVEAIIAAARSRADITENPALAAALNALMGQAYTWMVNGVPVEYRKSGDDMTVLLNTELLLPILKIGGALLADESIQKTIAETIASDPDMADMLPLIQGALQSLPDVINQTTTIEIGLAFTAK